MVQRCALVGLARSTHYYEPVPERAENLMLMRLIDELFLTRPFYGVPRMTDWLRTLGYGVNHKRVARLMRLMNLQAVVPGPHTSQPHPTHVVSPYLLRDLVVDRPNYVWCADITSVPMRRGFLYLVAVLDWYSRYVLAWALSNTLETRFCLVLPIYLLSATPPIFLTRHRNALTLDSNRSCASEAATTWTQHRTSSDWKTCLFPFWLSCFFRLAPSPWSAAASFVHDEAS
jgi:putative transposase